MRIHRVGTEIATNVFAGPVLTLSPIYPIEGGVSVYPTLSTGPFAWRIASFLPAARRDSYLVLGPDELEQKLAKSPPAAILTGLELERHLERPLVDFANRHQYVPVTLSNGATLWLPPPRH